MSNVKIGHAVMDENGKAEGAIEGDQTGKEIAFGIWYAKNKEGKTWQWYIEAKNDKILELIASNMEIIVENDDIGYSQNSRWSAYYSIVANDGDIAKAHGNLDCSSAVVVCCIYAGVKIKPEGYTGSLLGILKNTGLFNVYTDSDHISTDVYAKRGGIYLRNGHVLVVLENGSKVAATQTTTQSTSNDTSEAVTARPYVLIVGGSVFVRGLPKKPSDNMSEAVKKRHDPIATAYKGDKLEYLHQDFKTKWYCVRINGKVGYISNGKKYTELIQ